MVGNSQHGLECLRRSLYHCPPRLLDIPLVNLGNLLYKWGRVDDAITVVIDALAVNDLEVTTWCRVQYNNADVWTIWEGGGLFRPGDVLSFLELSRAAFHG